MQNHHHSPSPASTQENGSGWHYNPKEGTLSKGETTLHNVSECNDGLMIGRNYFVSGELDLRGVVSNGLKGYEIIAIGEYAFGGCGALVCLYLPSSLCFIGSFAFEGCEGLRHIYHEDTFNPETGEDIFKGCSGRPKIRPL